MNCPECGEEDYYEGLYGPNCINRSCGYYKGSKKLGDTEPLKAEKEAKEGSNKHRWDDVTKCIFCGEAPCKPNCEARKRRFDPFCISGLIFYFNADDYG